MLSSSPSPPASVTMGSSPRLPGSAAVQASLHLVSLFNLHLPPEKLSPSCILGLERAALPLFDALLYGQGQPIYKVKVSLLVSVLRNAGKFWPRAKAVSNEIEEAMGGAADIIEAAEQSFDSPNTNDEDPPSEFAPPVFTTMGQMDAWVQEQPQATNVEAIAEDPTLEIHGLPILGPGEMTLGMETVPLPMIENMTLGTEAASFPDTDEAVLGTEATPFPKTEEVTMGMGAIPAAPFHPVEAGLSEMETHPGIPMSYVKTEDQWF